MEKEGATKEFTVLVHTANLVHRRTEYRDHVVVSSMRYCSASSTLPSAATPQSQSCSRHSI
jgi:hypothetical protein